MAHRTIQVKATLKYGDLLQPPDMVSSAAFDRDDEYFATAGVSRRIKVGSHLALALHSGTWTYWIRCTVSVFTGCIPRPVVALTP